MRVRRYRGQLYQDEEYSHMTADTPTPVACPPQELVEVVMLASFETWRKHQVERGFRPHLATATFADLDEREREFARLHAIAVLSALPPEYRAAPQMYDALITARDYLTRPGLGRVLVRTVVEEALAKAKELP